MGKMVSLNITAIAVSNSELIYQMQTVRQRFNHFNAKTLVILTWMQLVKEMLITREGLTIRSSRLFAWSAAKYRSNHAI